MSTVITAFLQVPERGKGRIGFLHRRPREVLILAAAVFFLIAMPLVAWAAPVFTGAGNYVENRGPNTVGMGVGLKFQLYAFVTPGDITTLSVWAFPQVTGNPIYNLTFYPQPIFPTLWTIVPTPPYLGQYGSYSIAASDSTGGDNAVIVPDLPPYVPVIPLATNLSVTPGTTTPTVSWDPVRFALIRFNTPVSLATDSEGNIYVADSLNNQIQKFDGNGEFISQWGYADVPPLYQLNEPAGVATYTDPLNNVYVYVADKGNDRIMKYDSDGGFITTWGTTGTGPNQFNQPFGVATDTAGNVYVADTSNNRVLKFTEAGGYITQWGTLGTLPGQFNGLWGIATDSSGNVYTTEMFNQRVQVFDKDGGIGTQWGSYGSLTGQLITPYGVTTDGSGNVYVSEGGNNRVQKFNNSGTYISLWGGPALGITTVQEVTQYRVRLMTSPTDQFYKSSLLPAGTTSFAVPAAAGLAPDTSYAARLEAVYSSGGFGTSFESVSSTFVNFSTGIDPCAGHGGDTDGDGVCDDSDNCPYVNNRVQEDRDLDGVGDFCDNCPDESNPLQEDTNNDGMGDACGTSQESITVPPGPFPPGGPIWIDATFHNGTGQDLLTMCPDCYNTHFLVTDSSGNPIPPSCRFRTAYGIPADLCTIKDGESFTVRCDLSEHYSPVVLAAGSTVTYQVMATYANFIQDPDRDPVTGACSEPSGECYDIAMLQISSTEAASVSISGDPVEKFTVSVSFDPAQWDAGWASSSGGSFGSTIAARIVNGTDPRFNVCDGTTPLVNPATILLNGSVGIVSGSAVCAGGVLTAQFDRSDAVRSLGTAVSGSVAYPTLQGDLTTPANALIYGQSPVRLVSQTGTLVLQADRHVVGQGSSPSTGKFPIDGMEVRVFDKGTGSCAAGKGISWQHYPEIWSTCTAVASTSTSASGRAEFSLPPGDYLLIGEYTGANPALHPGVSVGELADGATVKKYMQVIVNGAGKVNTGKYQILTGSELLVIEPEYVEWTSTSELYPFVFQSLGDWSVETSVSPPEGFVADYPMLGAQVNSDLKAVQFTITDVGSEWKSTKVSYKIKHKGKTYKIDSKIGIKLSEKLAKEKGKSVWGDEPPEEKIK